jgi:hypothetical protein
MPTKDDLIKACAHLKLLRQTIVQLSRCPESAVEQMTMGDWIALFREMELHCDHVHGTFQQIGDSFQAQSLLRHR